MSKFCVLQFGQRDPSTNRYIISGIPLEKFEYEKDVEVLVS